MKTSFFTAWASPQGFLTRRVVGAAVAVLLCADFHAAAVPPGGPPAPNGPTGPTMEAPVVEPAQPKEGQPWSVEFHLVNNTKSPLRPLNGFVTVEVHNGAQPPAPVLGFQVMAVQVPIGQDKTGSFAFPDTGHLVSDNGLICTGTVTVTYYQSRTAESRPFAELLKEGLVYAEAQASTDFSVFVDRDKDGIDDAYERQLLARFRPLFRFSKDGGDEPYAPSTVRRYLGLAELHDSDDENAKPLVSQPDLAAGPDALLLIYLPPKGSTNLTANPFNSQFDYLTPVKSVQGYPGDHPGRNGLDWDTVRQKKNVGLYGHVVPLRRAPRPGRPPDPKPLYKIEYWQFFGFNSPTIPKIGDHESDWTTVQLVYDPEEDNGKPDSQPIRAVFHYAHGIQFEFSMVPTVTTVAPGNVDGGAILEYRGANYPPPGSPDLELAELSGLSIKQKPDQVAKAQNNVLQMFQAPGETAWEHPVVYIEYGSHEFYPSAAWKFFGAPKHGGDSYNYLTAPPPDLGEIDYPLADTDEAKLILQYNGYWGTKPPLSLNDPPPGPPLHKQWSLEPGGPSNPTRNSLQPEPTY